MLFYNKLSIQLYESAKAINNRQKMSLSNETIFEILSNSVSDLGDEKGFQMISYLLKEFFLGFYMKIRFSKKFKGWNKIETALPVLLIYLATESIVNKKEKIFDMELIPNKYVRMIYNLILDKYKTCCINGGLKFIPNIKGLETIITGRK